ncbi:hypothetical protein [Streptomyces sp. NPDC026589]|uniref:hypothetical protein n=1 Tax=Streptomyces sp. NPDC026589 TaxID=3155609 RepID=UPI0033DBF62D
MAIDLYLVWAVRSGRDVALSVAVAVSANVAGVLTTESLSAVGTWVSAGLHGVFPFSIWRMHRHSEPDSEASGGEPVRKAGSDWPPADLWADFEDSAPDVAPAVPPTADEIRSAMAALSSKHDRPVTGRMLADHFSVSDRTGRRYLAMAV